MAFRHFYTMVLALIFANTGHGELRDPTRPDTPVQPASSTEAGQADKDTLFTVSEIWMTSTSRRAVINGIKVKQGDTIFNDVQIVTINENQVTIKEKGIAKMLHLHQRSYTPR